MSNSILLPNAYFAPIEYYAYIIKYKKTKIEIQENFIKQTIRNRCYIYGSNGKLRLSIPVKKNKELKIKMKDVQICYNENWEKQHWNSIKSAYNSSPYFIYYKDEFQKILNKKEKYLVNLNRIIQEKILELLNISYDIKNTQIYVEKNNIIDLRNHEFINNNMNKYDQVFTIKHGFIPNLSILDLIFNLGPYSTIYLKEIII